MKIVMRTFRQTTSGAKGRRGTKGSGATLALSSCVDTRSILLLAGTGAGVLFFLQSRTEQTGRQPARTPGWPHTTPVASLVGFIDNGKFINVRANRQRNRYCFGCSWLLYSRTSYSILLDSVLGVLFQTKSNNASLFLHAKICAQLLNGFPP